MFFRTPNFDGPTLSVSPLVDNIFLTGIFTQERALGARGAIEARRTSLSATLDTIGAAQSRLLSAVGLAEASRENFIAAESRIRSADIAKEAAELVRTSILQQMSTATLAQANGQGSLILALLSPN